MVRVAYVYAAEKKREQDRVYHQQDDVKTRRKERESSPENKAHISDRHSAYMKEYNKRDYVREKRREYMRTYRAKQKAAT